MGRVLITGGAGFIGSFVVEHLLDDGHEVRVLDALDPQVHEDGGVPAYLRADVDVVDADVRDEAALDKALRGIDTVVHLAAAVGVGQSMYQLRRYVDVNSCGTAALLQALGRHCVERLVVASSMSIYGEGAYLDGEELVLAPRPRGREQLAARMWELSGTGGRPLAPMATGEEKVPQPASPYALTKYDQELLCLMYGAAYGVSTLALRLFNVYGPRQALSNPYTGVMAIFACRLLNGEPPNIFEDGAQLRDFVNVRDVARAFGLAVHRKDVGGLALNIGSGRALSVADVARVLADALGRQEIAPRVEGRYRTGDIRHCFADVSRARALLGYQPEVAFEDGVAELVEWLDRQRAVDRAPAAAAELERRGLTL